MRRGAARPRRTGAARRRAPRLRRGRSRPRGGSASSVGPAPRWRRTSRPWRRRRNEGRDSGRRPRRGERGGEGDPRARGRVPGAGGGFGTSAVTLQPVTRSVRQADGSVSERADGYRASNTVRVRLADMARLGELMRRALDGGANRIDGVGFGLRDPEAAESAMRVAAVKDARAQAERLAEAAGVTLGRVVSIQSRRPETPRRWRSPHRRRCGPSAAAPRTPGRRHHRDRGRGLRHLRDSP